MKYDKKWRQQINDRYRQTALASYLRQIDILEDIKDSEFDEVTETVYLRRMVHSIGISLLSEEK